MTQKEILAKKIADAQTNTTTVKVTGSITVPSFISWIKDTNKMDFDKKIMDLVITLMEKIQFLLHGKPYIIEHEDESVEANFHKDIMLQELMFQLEGILFKYGYGHVIIEKIGTKQDPRIQLRLADPNFPNVVTRLGNIKVSAMMWSGFVHNITKYYIQTIYTHDKIKTNVYSYDGGDMGRIAEDGKEEDLEEFNKLLPESLRIKGEMDNPYKFIPVVEVQYKPTLDFTWADQGDQAPAKRLEDKQAILDETVKIMLTEQYVNRTKMLVDKDLLASADKEDLATIADENILGVLKDSGGVDGENKHVEFVQGDPKLEQYWASIKNIVSIAVSDLKLSELDETQSASSATGEIFNKGNDVETSNTLQVFRQKAIAEILQKALAVKNNESFEEYAIDTSAWNVQLIPNVIMNEAKMTDIVVKQLGAGLINMIQAKVKLEGISAEDAKTALEEDDGILNPTLLATTSFGGGEEEDSDSETGNPKPEDA